MTDSVHAYRQEEPTALATVRRWVALASYPYRARLAVPWDDLQQELFVEIHEELMGGRFRGESQLKTYVWRCVNNSCIDLLRKQSRTPLALEPLEEETIPGREASPLDDVQAAERRRNLGRLIERMPKHCLELWRRILDGQSYRDMARDLGVREGTLRVRVLRCRKAATEARDDL